MINISYLVNLVFTNGYIDDHDKHHYNVGDYVLLHTRYNDVSLCYAETNSNFSVNPFYMDKDGNVHLSGNSNGGTVKARGTTMEKAVIQYNAEHTFDNFFSQLAVITRKQWEKKIKRDAQVSE